MTINVANNNVNIGGSVVSVDNGSFNSAFSGDMGFGGTWARWAHTSQANTTQYALLHNGTNGQTILNVASGQNCLFRQNNSTYGWGNSGGIAMNGYFSTSDSNNKESIKPLGRLLDKLDKIEGESFEWKQGKTEIKHKEGKHIGLLAQDLQKLCPKVVRENADGLCYELTAFNGVVIQLIKDLKMTLMI
jgi:hypothetical protein